MEVVAASLIGSDATMALGSALRQNIRTSEALAPEVARIDREILGIGNSAGSNITNLRSVVTLLREHNLPLANRREVIESFRQNSRVVTLTEDKAVYRYWVEGFNDPRGRWVTSELIDNPQVNLALPHGGPYKIQQWIIPAGTEVIEGLASQNFGMPGGGFQIYVPNPGVLR